MNNFEGERRKVWVCKETMREAITEREGGGKSWRAWGTLVSFWGQGGPCFKKRKVDWRYTGLKKSVYFLRRGRFGASVVHRAHGYWGMMRVRGQSTGNGKREET